MSDSESSDEETLIHDEELYLAFPDDTSEEDDDDEEEEVDDVFSALSNFVGGAPFWLNSSELPSDEQLTCTACDSAPPLIQLAQLYAPLERTPAAFHRVLHVLACVVCGGSFRLLRSQLPEDSPLYAAADVDSRRSVRAAQRSACATPLCFCGLPARKRCAQCSGQCYCSRAHQKADWPRHKRVCGVAADALPADLPAPPAAPRRLYFVTELELSAAERLAARRERDAVALAKQQTAPADEAGGGGDGEQDFPDDELEEAVSDSKASRDALFVRFQRRVDADPEQLLRYWHWDGTGDLCARGDAQVVWATSKAPRTSADEVPPCEHCGAKRSFEFQLMPQLLYFLAKQTPAASVVDFATLVGYTCTASCTPPTAYAAEHVFVQKFS